MSDVEVIRKKMSEIEEYAKTLRYLYKLGKRHIKSDKIIKGATERYLFLIMQATIDLAGAVVKYEKLGKPISYGEAFELLASNQIIDDPLAERLKQMVGARNILVHEYAKFKLDIILDELPQNLRDISLFLRKLKKHFMI